MESPIVITGEDALLVIDVQNDFLPGGALAVADGDAIIPLVDRLARAFESVVITQDWHPAGHASFASSHAGAKPFDVTELPYGIQVLWPDHCVQGSPGARLHSALDTSIPGCFFAYTNNSMPAIALSPRTSCSNTF